MNSAELDKQGRDDTNLMEENVYIVPPLDANKSRFPHCIVWSPLPVITWFLPFIGHLGIATSDGIIYDFAGPYTIGKDNFAFGAPTRYIQCTISSKEEADKWDNAIAKGCAVYETRMHNLFCDNCHSHVAECLRTMKYKGITRWNMIYLAIWMFFTGRYVDFISIIKTWGPFIILCSLYCVSTGIF